MQIKQQRKQQRKIFKLVKIWNTLLKVLLQSLRCSLCADDIKSKSKTERSVLRNNTATALQSDQIRMFLNYIKCFLKLKVQSECS